MDFDSLSESKARRIPRGGKRGFDRTTLQRLFLKVDATPGLSGAKIVYFDGRDVHVLRREMDCRVRRKVLLLRAVNGTNDQAITDPGSQIGDSKFYTEVLSASLSCPAAVISWFLIYTGSAAIPLTFGASGLMSAFALSGATATALQCGISVARAFRYAQGAPFLFDSKEWFRKTALALDIISMAGAVTATATTIKFALTTRKATSSSWIQILKKMPRHDRKRLTEEIIRQNNPGISNGALKAMVASGVYPRRYRQSVINSTVLMRLSDTVSALMGFTGSATGGVVRYVAVGIFEEIDAIK